MNDIDELYKEMLQSSEITPPDGLWDKLSARLSVEESTTANADSSLSHTISSSVEGGVKVATKIATWKVTAIAVVVGASVATATIISLGSDDNNAVHQQMNKATETVLPLDIDTVTTDIFSTSTLDNNKAHKTNTEVYDNGTLPIQPSEQPSVDINNVALITHDTCTKVVEHLSSNTNDAIDDNIYIDTIASVAVYEEPIAQDSMMEDNDVVVDIDSLKNVLQEIRESVNIIIPNIITPNYDTHNDCWKIVGIEDYYNVHVVVATRTGMIIYENKRYDNSWCPTDIPDGTYFYAITIISHNYHKKGVIEIRSK